MTSIGEEVAAQAAGARPKGSLVTRAENEPSLGPSGRTRRSRPSCPPRAAALAAYTALRRRHLNYYQLATRALPPLFQSDSRVIGWLRDPALVDVAARAHDRATRA